VQGLYICREFVISHKEFLFQYLNTSDDSEFTDSHGRNREANSPENFLAPWENVLVKVYNYWT